MLSLTLEGLERAGCRTALVAPTRPASTPLALTRLWRLPLALARHSQPSVRQEVERRLATERFDLVHVEQLQALPQAEPALRRGIPVVLRAQNVESDLWAATAGLTPGWKGRVLAREAIRLARWEGEAVRRVSATLPLSQEDAARLRQLSGGGRVRVVRAPFPELPPGPSPLEGDPPVVLLVSRGWLPNEDSVRWFLRDVWPVVRAEVPGAVLHVFGSDGGPGTVHHPPPKDSAEAFAPGSILAVPLRIGSGVRMKVLEAWARGVPVVGTSAAVSGLEVVDGREALVADDPASFARAVARVRSEADRLIENGRRALKERHDPAAVVKDLVAVYEEVLGSRPPARSDGS